MKHADDGKVEADAMRAVINEMGLNQKSFAMLMGKLGDTRELSSIHRGVQRMVTSDVRVSGEMLVILTLLRRERSRARRLAEAIQWQSEGGRYSAEVQGVRLLISAQSGGRWSIVAQHVADGSKGHSPQYPHWRDSLEEAKIRAVLAIDETLDEIASNSDRPE